ncbi:MAG TPA: hypothetical protein VJ838_02310 [Gaiellaceae bacterium]|nr:hypothetical protein [Gaiellaceae bacterium]
MGLAAVIVAVAFGVSIFGGWKLPHWWYGLLILAAFYAVLFVEGAFRVYRDTAALLPIPSENAFPNSAIEVKPFAYVQLSPQEDVIYDERVFLFNVRATNREETKRLNLSFEIEVVRSPRQEPPITGRFSRTHTVAKRQYENEVLPEVVDIGPGRTVSGLLKMSEYTAGAFLVCDDDHHFEARGSHTMQAIVRDHVSGQEITFEIPGTWSR